MASLEGEVGVSVSQLRAHRLQPLRHLSLSPTPQQRQGLCLPADHRRCRVESEWPRLLQEEDSFIAHRRLARVVHPRLQGVAPILVSDPSFPPVVVERASARTPPSHLWEWAWQQLSHPVAGCWVQQARAQAAAH